MKRFLTHWLAACAMMFTFAAAPVAAQSDVVLVHVHGLSYSADGKQLLIPSHIGLAIYSAGRWSKAPGPTHDFMGFSATHDALYSSGHPAPGSDIRNPFGLLKSSDGGKTWTQLGLTGEADFHVMATSHAARAVYVYAPIANSRMQQAGIYHTADDGKTWIFADGRGLAGRIGAMAVHPSNAKVVAVATDAGLFLSEDYGGNFKPVAADTQATSVQFDLDGTHLLYGDYASQAALTKLAFKTGKRESMPLPAMTQDAVAYIAQNPANKKQYAIATFARDVYLSNDSGKTWKTIAQKGETR